MKMTKFDQMAEMIGHTPLLEIAFLYKGEERKIYAKAEYYNLSGSIKDRVAYYILKKAYITQKIHADDMIVEATSGNTGIAFAALGSYLGHQVVIYMPDWMSCERIKLMKSYGAEVRLVSKEEGGFIGAIEKTKRLASQGGVFLPAQFDNQDNIMAHYLLTGEEIDCQLEQLGLEADGFVAGVGTGGTVMGVGRRLKEINPKCKAYPLEPSNSPTLSTGYKVGKHRIQGISDEFVPSIVDKKILDDVIAVDDEDAIIMAQMLAQQLGLGVGISSGANFLGCVLAQEKIGAHKILTTIFADDNKKYLSTDYSKEYPIKSHYLTKDIELIGFKAYR